MDWLIIQSAGKHRGDDGWCRNDYLREGLAIRSELISMGHICHIWGMGYDGYDTVPDFNSYDVILVAEQYEFEWVPDLSKYTRPVKVQWVVDLHYHSKYGCITPMCNIVLHATRGYMGGYSKLFSGQKHIWWPNSVDRFHFHPHHLTRDIPCCFVGKVSGSAKKRGAFVKKLGIPSFFRTGSEMINTISRTMIHFNHSIGSDINYRCFETIGLGTCLLTNRVPDMDKLGFVSGENCLLFDGISGCRALLKKNLDGGWGEIAKNGVKLAESNTYGVRLKELINNVL